MEKYNRILFKNSVKYDSFTRYEKRIDFYSPSNESKFRNHSLTIYDGDTFHILCKKGLYNACFVNNNLALEELQHKLVSRNSFRLNLKHIILTFFWSIPIIFLFLFSFKFISYGKSFAEAEKVLNMYRFIIGFYFVGHLLRIFVGKRYKDSRYKNIFNFLKNKQFIEDYDKYKRKTQTFYNTSGNPYHLPLLKNIFRLIFFICFYLGIFLLFTSNLNPNTTFINGSLKNQLTFFNDIFLPSTSESSYQLADISHVLGDEYSRTFIYGDYFLLEGDMGLPSRIYDMDFNLVFDKSYIPGLEVFGIREIVDNFMLIEAKFYASNYTEIIIYDLESNEVKIQIDNTNFPVPNVIKLQSNNFEIVNNKFYLSIYYYAINASYNDDNYSNGVLEINGDEMNFHNTGNYEIHDIEYLDDSFYYIIGLHDMGKSYTIGKSDLNIIEIELSDADFTYARNLLVYDNKLYLTIYTIASELIEFDKDFNFKSIGIGLNKASYSSTQNLFIFGNDKTSFIEYNAEGNILNQGVSCTECDDSLLFYLKNQELYALGDSNTLYHFSKTNEPFKYFNNAHVLQDAIPSYDLDIDTLYTYVIAVMLAISSISYFLMIKSLFVKYNTDEFFDLIQK